MKKFFTTAVSVVSMLTATASAEPKGNAPGSAFDFQFQSIDSKPMALEQWRGKVLLVVNTASFCGYTKQYAGLQELWTKYESKGLVVVGVPSNDFGGQEPKAEGEIKTFCQGAFGVTFPLTSKEPVTGPNAHAFYKWATTAAGADGAPRWNFHKYLISRDGRLIRSFTSTMTPMSDEVTGWVEKALAEPQKAASAE